MIDLDQLERLTKGAMRCEWGDAVEWAQVCGDHGEGKYVAACNPAAILELVAEVRRLREDKARLDSGCIMRTDWDDWGDTIKIESRGNDLRKMIDEAMASADKEKA
jgi:hypothetical protein